MTIHAYPKPPSRLKQITAGQLLDMNFPPREFAIDPWLRTGESALIWAATGVGKTWLTLSLALAMAGGGSVWEWSSPKARKVLLVDGEMNVQDLQERTRMLLDNGGVRGFDREALRSNFLLMPRQHQDPRATFYDITDAASQDRILDRMERTGAEVVIVDNLTTCADGLNDENDAVAFRSVMGFLLKMKQAGKTAILVHHANKSGTDARGSTALEATFEVKLGLHRVEDRNADRAEFKADFGKFRAKARDGLMLPRIWRLTPEGWAVEEDEDALEGRVKKALERERYTTQTELAEALGVHKSTVTRAMQSMAARGIADKVWMKERFDNAKARKAAGEEPLWDEFEDAESHPQETEGQAQREPWMDF